MHYNCDRHTMINVMVSVDSCQFQYHPTADTKWVFSCGGFTPTGTPPSSSLSPFLLNCNLLRVCVSVAVSEGQA